MKQISMFAIFDKYGKCGKYGKYGQYGQFCKYGIYTKLISGKYEYERFARIETDKTLNENIVMLPI